jgi:hypothetical protein
VFNGSKLLLYNQVTRSKETLWRVETKLKCAAANRNIACKQFCPRLSHSDANMMYGIEISLAAIQAGILRSDCAILGIIKLNIYIRFRLGLISIQVKPIK